VRFAVVVSVFCLMVLEGMLVMHSLSAYELTPPSSQWDYHLGQSLRVGNTGLTLGGYGSVRYEDFRHYSP